MSRFALAVGWSGAVASMVLAVGCEEPPPRGANDWTYQNGYPQSGAPGSGQSYAAPAVTYTPQDTATAQTTTVAPSATTTTTSATQQPPPTQIQTTPVPLGVQTLPPPVPTTNATPLTPIIQMAIPGPGAFVCTNDGQCMLGKCNTTAGKCAYPCKTSEVDCKPGNVCTKSGVCLPRAAAGVSM